MTLNERASYIRGLLDGMDLSKSSGDAKLFVAMSELLSELAEKVTELEELQENVCDVVDDLAEELVDVEEFVGYDDCCCCDEELDGECSDDCCDCCGMPLEYDEDDEDDE